MLVPLALAFGGARAPPRALALIGDPHQLPATVASPRSVARGFARSLMARLLPAAEAAAPPPAAAPLVRPMLLDTQVGQGERQRSCWTGQGGREKGERGCRASGT